MIRLFEEESPMSALVKVTQSIISTGKEHPHYRQPFLVKELFPVVITFDPHFLLVDAGVRAYNPAFMVAETVWNLVGDTDEWLAEYNGSYHTYFENGSLKAGYGNRLYFDFGINQIESIIANLKANKESLHAVCEIKKPEDVGKKFCPCIIGFAFLIRDDKLHMISYMRSQDMMRGFPYDINLLGSIFFMVAQRFGIEVGTYTHQCNSVQIFSRDYKEAEKINWGNYDNWKRSYSYAIPQFNFESILEYRNAIRDVPIDYLEELKNNKDVYWRDAIKTCYAYRLLKSDTATSFAIANSMEGYLKEQYFLWGRNYFPKYFK